MWKWMETDWTGTRGNVHRRVNRGNQNHVSGITHCWRRSSVFRATDSSLFNNNMRGKEAAELSSTLLDLRSMSVSVQKECSGRKITGVELPVQADRHQSYVSLRFAWKSTAHPMSNICVVSRNWTRPKSGAGQRKIYMWPFNRGLTAVRFE